MEDDRLQPILGQPAISQYWNDELVPGYIDDLFDTFRAWNPDCRHRVFSESDTERLIAERFGPRQVSAFRALAVPSMQSDYFRYCSVLTFGGVYSDADYRCIRNLGPLVDRLDCGEVFCRPDVQSLNGRKAYRVLSGFFAFKEPGHPFLELALEIATANVEARISERVWEPGEKVIESIWLTVGPGIFTLMHFLHLLGSFEELVDVARGTAAEPFMELFCDVVGSYDRIVEAFDGVRVSPFDSMWSWIAHPEAPLAYKDTDVHWQNVKTRIFR